ARLVATDPAGRGRVKLEVQACPIGKNFGAPECSSSISAGWSDVTATAGGQVLTQTVPGLGGTVYRWRARVLHAPFRIVQPGITAPPKSPHGPWRRLGAQAVEADVRLEGGGFHTLNPCRVVDTRMTNGVPIGGPILTSGAERSLLLRGNCGIPFVVRAVSANVTV